MKVLDLEFKTKFRWLTKCKKKKGLQVLTGIQFIFMIYALFKINVIQGSAIGMNDLLNIEVGNDNLKTFDQAWEGSSMAMDHELDMAHLGCLYY